MPSYILSERADESLADTFHPPHVNRDVLDGTFV